MTDHECPGCKRVLIDHIDAFFQGYLPEENDYSICAKCYAVLQFNKDLSLRVARRIPREVARIREKFIRLDMHSRN